MLQVIKFRTWFFLNFLKILNCSLPCITNWTFSIKWTCLVKRCLSKFDFFLCTNLFLQIRQVGRPFRFRVNAKISVHSTLNSRFSSSIFLCSVFVAMPNRVPRKMLHFIIVKDRTALLILYTNIYSFIFILYIFLTPLNNSNKVYFF